MDLIAALNDSQKIQETAFADVIAKLQEFESETINLAHEKESLVKEVVSKDKIINDLQVKLDTTAKGLEEMRASFQKDLFEAKEECEEIKEKLEITLQEVTSEMKILEDKNEKIDNELANTKTKLNMVNYIKINKNIKYFLKVSKNENILISEVNDLKKKLDTTLEEKNKFKLINEQMSNEIHALKIRLHQAVNIQEKLSFELKRSKEEFDLSEKKSIILKEEKAGAFQKINEMTQKLLDLKHQENEIKDVKIYLKHLVKVNSSMEQKLGIMSSFFQRTNETVETQTDISALNMNEFETIDREATLTLLKLREEIVGLKDKLLEAKEENDTLKNFVREIKRERQFKEEEERVTKMEETVRNLANAVNRDEISSNENEILKTLKQVKNDLSILKGEQPTKLVTFRNFKR